MTQLMLDPAIRDWVLIPIVIIMFFVGLLRHHAMRLLASEQKTDKKQVVTKHVMMRSDFLRRHAGVIPESAFQMRKAYFNNKEGGQLTKEADSAEAPNPMAQMQDPSMMGKMMKNNMVMMVTQMGMMGVVSTFFSGFITAKIPFSLSYRFKSMLQKGVELNSLDVSYVSSLSWYFMILFGLRGLFSVVLGDDNETDDAKIMESQMKGGMGGQPGQDMKALFKAQVENLEIVEHQWSVATAEQSLLAAATLSPAERTAFAAVRERKPKRH